MWGRWPRQVVNTLTDATVKIAGYHSKFYWGSWRRRGGSPPDFENQAVVSYTHYLEEIDAGRAENIPAPRIAIELSTSSLGFGVAIAMLVFPIGFFLRIMRPAKTCFNICITHHFSLVCYFICRVGIIRTHFRIDFVA